MAITAVCAVPLLDGIGATFVQDEHGWRFQKWHMPDDTPPAHPPTKTDRDRHFETCEAAATFFRDQYANWLRHT